MNSLGFTVYAVGLTDFFSVFNFSVFCPLLFLSFHLLCFPPHFLKVEGWITDFKPFFSDINF